MGERTWGYWRSTPTAVRIAVLALVFSAATVPLFVGVAYALDPEVLPRVEHSRGQVAAGLAFVLFGTLSCVLLLAYLLLRRSRLAALVAVTVGVLATARDGLSPTPLEVVGDALSLATWLPLFAPTSVRWFCSGRTGSSPMAYGGAPDLRRPD